MAGYLYVIIASYNVLKPMTRSLFVSELGLQQLPFLYILLVLAVGAFITVYLKISARLRLNRLINLTLLFLGLNLLVFRWLLSIESNSAVLYYTLFIWTSIYGVLTPTQFWLLANTLFNAREAKRLFPHLTTFAILGGITGGYVTRFLVKAVGTTNLSFLCMGLLAIAAVLMNYAWQCREQMPVKKRQVESKHPDSKSLRLMGEMFGIVRKSKHLSALMGIVAITFMVVQIADFQFVAYGNQASTGMDDLTGFLGFWLSNMSIIALLFQIFFANSIIRHFGVGATILFLPVAILLSSFWVFFNYGLLSVLALKIGDGAFRHSINKVGMELLYLPIPPEIKKKTKAFVDMFVDRFGRGMAGVILLIFYSWLGFSVAQISLISIVAVIVWLSLSFVTHREYVNSFRQALARRSIDAELISVSIKDEATIDSLIMSLASSNERQVVYALQLLESVARVNLAPALKPLLRHPSAEIRYHTLHLIRSQRIKELREDVKTLLNDSDERVQREAVFICAAFHKGDRAALLKKWLQDEKDGLRTATIFYLAEHPALSEELLSLEMIELLVAGDKKCRRQMAEALGILNDKKYYPYLMQLLHDRELEVRLAAIRSAGLTAARDFVHILLRHLYDRSTRKAARQALADYGETVVPLLAETFHNPETRQAIRYEIPKILGLIASQKSVEFLLDNLNQNDEGLRHQMIKALNKIRASQNESKFDQRVDEALFDECKRYFTMLSLLHRTNATEDARNSLLTRTLQERLDDHLERMFRLLGLRYPPRDIYNAYAATHSDNKTIRANAIEFLDNILSPQHKRLVLPLVEELPADQVLQRVNSLIDFHVESQKQALEYLVRHNHDPWLCAVTLYEIGQKHLTAEFASELERAATHSNELIRETARLVLNPPE